MRVDRDRRRADPAAGGDVITPTVFVPPTVARGRGRRRLRWVTIAGAVLLAGLAVVLWFVLAARSVELATLPEAATIALTGGPVLSLGGRHLALPGRYRVAVSHPGYHSQTLDIDVGTDASQRFEIRLERLPGHLSVQSTPAGARIWVDDDARGTTPLTVRALTPGSHQVRVEAARYRPYTTTVDIAGLDQTQHMQVDLEPAWATVTVRSEPAGATLHVDGVAVGVTPVAAELLAGERHIEVSLAGHASWRQALDVVAGHDLELETISLQPANGWVDLATMPAGAAVTVDGVYQGVTPLELSLTPETDHHLEVHKDGHASAQRKVRVESGQRQRLTIRLAVNEGQVTFAIQPRDATLFIDGRVVEQAERTLELPARDHRVRIAKAGYAEFETTVRPRPGVEQRIAVVLKTLAQAALESASPTLTSPGGQELKLFRPDARFTMGASRREQGRRSNEVLRRVHVNRPFYLAVAEVTNAEFRRFAPNHSSGHFKGQSLDGDRYPVVRIDWEQAARYCNWLSEQASLPPFYRISGDRVTGFDAEATGFRMPTEAEWEWAARVSDGELRKYPWGASFPPATVNGNYADRTAAAVTAPVLADYVDNYPVSAPVQTFAPQEKGLYDLGGNVAEWVHDYYSIVPNASGPWLVNPLGPQTGEYHVIRGSSWAHGGISELRLSFRDYGREARPDVGFRVARWLH